MHAANVLGLRKLVHTPEVSFLLASSLARKAACVLQTCTKCESCCDGSPGSGKSTNHTWWKLQEQLALQTASLMKQH